MVLFVCAERSDQLFVYDIFLVLLHYAGGFYVLVFAGTFGGVFILRSRLDTDMHIGEQ